MSDVFPITAGDATLAVRIDGDEDLPWLVLSNSLATDMTMWDAQISELSRLRRIVRYDTRGHGRSSAPAGPYNFDRLVDDVIAVMNHLHIRTADILGLSLGGMTALGLGLDHPERVRRLICCDARAVFPPTAIAGWDQRMSAVASGGMSAILEETLARWFTPMTHRVRPDIIERGRRMVLSTSAVGYRGCAAALKTLDYFRRLSGLRRSTLYLVGEEDSGAPVAAMREMAAATPRADFIVVPGAAHIANMENSAAFNAAVCDFLLKADVAIDDARLS
jgi:3-oxoadipate enol-lactonase